MIAQCKISISRISYEFAPRSVHPFLLQMQPSLKRVVSFSLDVEVIVIPGSDHWGCGPTSVKLVLKVMSTYLSKYLLCTKQHVPIFSAVATVFKESGVIHFECRSYSDSRFWSVEAVVLHLWNNFWMFLAKTYQSICLHCRARWLMQSWQQEEQDLHIHNVHLCINGMEPATGEQLMV